MELSSDTLKAAYYGLSAAFVALLGWNGWRQGFARQFMTLLSIVCAYAAAWYCGPLAAPTFGFLKYPPQITLMIASAAVGLTTFLGLHGLRRILFKQTAQQKNPTVRLSYGILGAFINVMFGSLVFLFTTGAIRAIGTVAQSRMHDMEKEQQSPAPLPPADPGPLVRSFAKLGGALDEGKSGEFLQRYDKVPAAHVFTTLAKLGIMVSRPESVDRFLAYPGVEKLATHPKLIAVRNDPSVSELLLSRSFIKLLRHEKVVALANDEEFNSLIKKMEFDKALDHALTGDKPLETLPETLLPSASN
jgi:hypothetical protein